MSKDSENTRAGTRLNRAIASRGVCSRRKADELIFAGKVKVNGVAEKNPSRIAFESDEIEIDGRKIAASIEKVYYMLNKPVHCVSTVKDPQGRKTVLDLFPKSIREKRIFPVGRLDYFSEGLLLLTNDGDLAYRLTHPSFEKSKVYEVRLRDSVPESSLAEMRKGMILSDGTTLAPVKVESRALPRGQTLLIMGLKQGINRQIRRMCEKFNFTILSLKRISEGSLRLGDLKSGEYRALSDQEIAALKDDAKGDGN